MRKLFDDSSGQVILEYVLMLALAVTLVVVFARGMRNSIYKLWKTIAREVAGPCPGCGA